MLDTSGRTHTTDVPVRKRLREPLAAFLRKAATDWIRNEPLPIGVAADRYYAGWTQAALIVLTSEGVIPVLFVEGGGGTYAEFIVEELLQFAACADQNDGCPEGVEGSLRLAADLMALAADVEAAA